MPGRTSPRLLLSYVESTTCSPYPTLNLRRPSFSSRCCTDLEQSSAAYHIRSITSHLLLKNFVTRNYCCHAREVTLSIMDTLIALTYLLTSFFSPLLIVSLIDVSMSVCVDGHRQTFANCFSCSFVRFSWSSTHDLCTNAKNDATDLQFFLNLKFGGAI